MGTVVSFAWRAAPAPEDAARAAVRAACERLHEIDHRFSTWLPRSPLSRIRRGEVDVADEPEIAALLERCRHLREVSAGWFDPWKAPGGVDPTGIVKGWAAEEAARILADSGVGGALVNAGGDIASVGTPAEGTWSVGIRHPWRPEALAGVVALAAGGAIASSGTYERGMHLWRPDGRSPRCVAASVAGPSLATADALATALAVAGEELVPTLAALPDYEGWCVTADGAELETRGFPWAAPETARMSG